MSLLDTPDDSPAAAPVRSSPLRKVLPFTTVALIIAALYVAWTFYSRRQSDQFAQQQIADKQQQARQRVVSQVFGDGEIKFTSFSVDVSTLHPGQKAQLCYGVLNAKTVKIDPPIEPLKPTYQHCMEISPTKTTTYTITADDGKGHTRSQSLTVPVN